MSIGGHRHTLWKLSFLRWGGRGGEGGVNWGSIDTHFVGREGGEGRGCRLGVDQHSLWKLSFLRWGGG